MAVPYALLAIGLSAEVLARSGADAANLIAFGLSVLGIGILFGWVHAPRWRNDHDHTAKRF